MLNRIQDATAYIIVGSVIASLASGAFAIALAARGPIF